MDGEMLAGVDAEPYAGVIVLTRIMRGCVLCNVGVNYFLMRAKGMLTATFWRYGR
jgi:hypothetical protein